MSVQQTLHREARGSITAACLRSQAASCRRLAAVARTIAGAASLAQLADQFDAQAQTLDPSS